MSDKPDDDELAKMSALISFYLNDPYPERLDDETFGAKFQQADWLRRNGYGRAY